MSALRLALRGYLLRALPDVLYGITRGIRCNCGCRERLARSLARACMAGAYDARTGEFSPPSTESQRR